MSEQQLANDILGGVAKALTPTPAASVFKTFALITRFLFALAWLIALPIEMILHRLIGKRYINTVFCFLALVLMGVLTNWLAPAPLPSWMNSPLEKPAASVRAVMTQQLPFNNLASFAVCAFVVHYWCNRRRFGQENQGHSFDFGIPWLIFPPLPTRLIRRFLGLTEFDQLVEPKPMPALNGAEVLAYPLAVLRQWRAILQFHTVCVLEGRAPYGPFVWFFVAWVEPLLVGGVGAVICFQFKSYSAFGIYLMIVGAALALKAAIHQAEWRERIYDDGDQRVEAEAMRNWRSGKPSTQLSAAFTVPVMRAVLPPQRSIVDEAPIKAGPGFEGLMRPEASESGPGLLFPDGGTA